MKAFYKGENPTPTLDKELNTEPEKLEFFFIDVYGKEVKIFPKHGILGNTFIYCIRLDTGEPATIHYRRLQWRKIK